jgi:hypothetical protein
MNISSSVKLSYDHMWRLTSRFFIGMFATAIFTNAVAVFLLHDVDADRIGKWSLAYRELTLEFLVFSFVLTVFFLLLTWIGTMLFRLRHVTLNLKLGFVLGITVVLIQYPAEFTVRKLTGHPSDAFLLGYLLLSPTCCAAIVLLNGYKRRGASLHSQATEVAP